MLRGGGLCVASPAEDSSLPRISPRIRALQDRLLESLPADGAWECLSPAQREAIISLHRARLTRNLKERDLQAVKQNRKFNKGLSRYGRSRSYEDKLESETDDSGVRLQSAGASSASHSQNSQEDDSSDPGAKKIGRFAKSPSADRILKKDVKAVQDPYLKRKGVTNGFGNVNKIISKQLTKAGNHSASKVTLDCRNLQGDRSRSRIDKNNPFSPDANHGKKPAISRKNILQRYEINKESKSSASSEDAEDHETSFDARKTPDHLNRYRKNVPLPRIDYDEEIESDLNPRSLGVPSPSGLRYPRNYQEERTRYSWTEGIIGSSHGGPQSMPPMQERNSKKDLQSGAKLNSSFDYRTQINQDPFNKYSSNWNSIILSNHIPIRPSRTHQNKHKNTTPPLKSNEPSSGNSSGDSGYREPSRPTSGDSWYRDASRGSSRPYNREVSGDRMQYRSQSSKEDSFECRSVDSGNDMEHSRQPTVSRQDRVSAKKYLRSKSLDRNLLAESSDDESDFEFRRRTDRLLRYAKNSQESESNKYYAEDRFLPDRKYKVGKPIKDSIGRKSSSAWDLSISHRNNSFSDLQEFGNCFKSRSNIINKWRSQDGDFVLSESKPTPRTGGGVGDFSRMQWQRRSCDIDLDFCEPEPVKKAGAAPRQKQPRFDKNQWHRRSLDGQLDVDEEESPLRRSRLYSQDWDDSISKEMKIVQHREFFKNQKGNKKNIPIQPPQKEARPKKPKIEKDLVSPRSFSPPQAYRHGRPPQNGPSTFYPNSTCPDHGWRSPRNKLYEGRHRSKSSPEQNHQPSPSSKKERGKGGGGPFRGKLKFFRSIILSF